LGRLVSLLPLPNYTLLRALTAHLIKVVQNSDVNKMTVRNVGIVFSPTLGIPAGVFHLFISEFHYIFWTTDDGEAAPRGLDVEGEEEDEVEEELHANEPEAAAELASTPAESNTASATPSVDATPSHKPVSRNPTQRLREEHSGRNNRNSMHYLDGAPESIVGLEKGLEGQCDVLAVIPFPMSHPPPRSTRHG
jgi:RalA-binding protein 1